MADGGSFQRHQSWRIQGSSRANNAFLLKLRIFQESREHFSFSPLLSPFPPQKKKKILICLGKMTIRLKSQNGTAKKSELCSWLTPWGGELGDVGQRVQSCNYQDECILELYCVNTMMQTQGDSL